MIVWFKQDLLDKLNDFVRTVVTDNFIYLSARVL
jgi:hypothetical protein